MYGQQKIERNQLNAENWGEQMGIAFWKDKTKKMLKSLKTNTKKVKWKYAAWKKCKKM